MEKNNNTGTKNMEQGWNTSLKRKKIMGTSSEQ